MNMEKNAMQQGEPEVRVRVTAEVELADEEAVRRLIIRCATAVLRQEKVDFPAFIDVTIIDDEEIRRINSEHRGKDSVTDVLSFPMYEFCNGEAQEELDEDPESGCVMLGDMLLNYDRAVQQAEEYGHTPARECGYLSVHSVLHLLGYDHERGEADCRLMRKREEAVLELLGLTRG